MVARIYSAAKEAVTVPQIPYSPEAQAVRFQRSEQALKEAGGKRVNVRLRPAAAKKLERLKARWKTDQTGVINRLLEQA